jgi:hypothetical protein
VRYFYGQSTSEARTAAWNLARAAGLELLEDNG